MPKLKVTLPDGHSREFPLAAGRTTIGRGADCTVVVENPTLSRAHAAIEESEGAWLVTDLGSKNGVRIDGRAVLRGTVKAGEKFRLGKIECVILAEGAPGVPPAASFATTVKAKPVERPSEPETRDARSEADGDTSEIPSIGNPRRKLVGVAAALGGLAVAGAVLVILVGDGGKKAEKPQGPAVVRQVVPEVPKVAAPEAVEKEPEAARVPETTEMPDPEAPRPGEVRVRFRDGTARVGEVLRKSWRELEIAVVADGRRVEETYPIEDVLRIGDETVRPDWDRVYKARFPVVSSPEQVRAAEEWCRKYGYEKGRHELTAKKPENAASKKPAVEPGKVRFLGRLVDEQELRAAGQLDARGRLVLPVEERRFVREVTFDLQGRSPTEVEIQVAAAESRDEFVTRMLRSVEHFETWYEEELYYFLLLDNFRPATARLVSMPQKMSAGSLTIPDAMREIVISQYFNHRNPGNDTYVTVVFEQLLGMVVQDQPMLLKVGKAMYDGYEGKVFGENGASQSDLVSIVFRQRKFHELALERLHRRITGHAMDPRRKEAQVDRVAADPAAWLDVMKEWLLSDEYIRQAQSLRRKSDHQFIRALYVDLLGRRPTYEEFRSFRNALQALADPTPIRSVLAKVMVDSDQVKLGKVTEARAWVAERFETLLGRPPTESELKAFTEAVQKGSPRLAIQALLDSEEYQHY